MTTPRQVEQEGTRGRLGRVSLPAPGSVKRESVKRVLNVWERLTGPLYWLYESRLERSVAHGPLPKHIGLIMDGNRRFAKSIGLDVATGHDYGAGKAREVLECVLTPASNT